MRPSDLPSLRRKIKALSWSQFVTLAVNLGIDRYQFAEQWSSAALLDKFEEQMTVHGVSWEMVGDFFGGVPNSNEVSTLLFSGDLVKSRVASPRRRLILLIHGIRTRAEWAGRISNLIRNNCGAIVEPIGYGYFDVFRFICPIGTRRRPLAIVLRKLRDAFQRHRGEYDEVVVVAHSFGTYLVGEILRNNPDIHIHRLLLCGSVISDSFPWDRLPNRPSVILNEAGSRDIWPILAKSCTWGFGSTGTFGFLGLGVHDRFHNIGHSDYFELGFAEKYWLSWITTDTIATTGFEMTQRPPTPLFKSLIDVIPLKFLFVVFSLAVLVFLVFRWHSI